MELSLPRLAARIPNEAAAYEFMEELRWHGRPVCPHCGSLADHRYLTPTNGASRETTRGTQSERRVWKCRTCQKQFSVITGTVMHGSHVPLRTWLFVIFEMVSNKNGIAAREIERRYDLHPKTAWTLLHRIRDAMSERDGALFIGNVVVDETYIGGNPENRHAATKGPRKFGRGTDKTPVLSVIGVEEGIARSRVVANITGGTLGAAIAQSVAMAEATMHTDTYPSYGPIGATMAGHFQVDHKAGQYVTEKSHGTNKAENYFSQLKRSLDGTHHHISREHLPRYLAEFDFRYSTREMTDTARMDRFMGQVTR